MRELPETFTQHELGAASEHMLMRAAGKGGVGYIVRRGLHLPADLVGQLKGKWYRATFKDEADSFAVHYQKHVLHELQKAGRPMVSMKKYFNDAQAFWTQNRGRAFAHPINRGTEIGLKIDGNPGGVYTKTGEVVSFWYVPSR